MGILKTFFSLLLSAVYPQLGLCRRAPGFPWEAGGGGGGHWDCTGRLRPKGVPFSYKREGISRVEVKKMVGKIVSLGIKRDSQSISNRRI